MRPSEQEERCAAAICQHLSQNSGGDWRVKDWLDAQCDDEPSPDVIVSDGSECIAIEIKQLTDGDSFHTYEQTRQSLYKRLAPDSTRSFVLFPPTVDPTPL